MRNVSLTGVVSQDYYDWSKLVVDLPCPKISLIRLKILAVTFSMLTQQFYPSFGSLRTIPHRPVDVSIPLDQTN